MSKMTLGEAVRDAQGAGAEFYHTATQDCYFVVYRPRRRRKWWVVGRVVTARWERQVYQRDAPLFDQEHRWFVICAWHRVPLRDLEFAMTRCFGSMECHPALSAGEEEREAIGAR